MLCWLHVEFSEGKLRPRFLKGSPVQTQCTIPKHPPPDPGICVGSFPFLIPLWPQALFNLKRFLCQLPLTCVIREAATFLPFSQARPKGQMANAAKHCGSCADRKDADVSCCCALRLIVSISKVSVEPQVDVGSHTKASSPTNSSPHSCSAPCALVNLPTQSRWAEAYLRFR